MNWVKVIEKVREPIRETEEKILRFLRDIVAIPSMEGRIREVGERIAAEMKRLDFEGPFDRMGTSAYRNGPIRLLTAIDTPYWDREAWGWDPSEKVENGILVADQ
jgi:acetylornithine deacetylase/succinyl-diaminopimelate desuccinylase-like protein